MMEAMKKRAINLHSFRAFAAGRLLKDKFDPGRDDESDRRYMVSIGDPDALLMDDELRVKELLKRMHNAFLESDKRRMVSCARTIDLICKKYRPRTMMTDEVFNFDGWRDTHFIAQIFERGDALRRGDQNKRRKALYVLGDFCREFVTLYGVIAGSK
jgi:hypothetical protein